MSRLAGPLDAGGDCSKLGQSCALSDYDGLAPSGAHGFVAAFELTAPWAVNGQDDIFETEIR